MAFNIKWPFLGFRLKLNSGQQFIVPLNELNYISVDSKLERLAKKYEQEFQQILLNKGQYRPLLDVNNQGEYYKGPIRVAFPAAADGMRHPSFELEFDYYVNLETQGGAWASVPALGVQTYAEDKVKIEQHILEVIQLEFSRKRRLAYVQRIVSAIWFDAIEMLRTDLHFQLPNLREVHESSPEQQQDSWLVKVARPLQFTLPQAYGRTKEMESLEKAAKAKFSSSILLVGPAGSGKTTLVWELAYRRQQRKKNMGKIWETTAAHMIKELTADSGWEENLTQLCQELSKRPDFLFIRNLFELFEVGHYEGNEISMAEYIKNYLNTGGVHLISECTEEELARIELRSPNFVSLFQVIRITEPEAHLEEMIIQKVEDLAGDRPVQIDPEAVREAIRLTKRYMPYAGFPGRPVAFLERILLNTKPSQESTRVNISASTVLDQFCEESGIPRFMIDTDTGFNLVELRDQFNRQVFGQQPAVERITDLIATVKTGLTRLGKPIASFLFVGPTGVGKTEMCKALARFMFSDAQRMTRFDMSEFADPYAVIRLMGEGFHRDGLLSAAVRRQPFSLILFDEIEKAHPSFYDLLLQLLSEGRLSDGRGRLVNFCSTIIIMTSNIGAERLQLQKLGWSKQMDVEEVNDYFIREVQQFFRPEIYNRIDAVIPFAPLSKQVVRQVVNREMELFQQREGIQFRSMDLIVEDAVLDELATIGYEPKYGARQLQRTIREKLVIPLARRLNEEHYDDQLVVTIHPGRGGALDIEVEADQLGLDLWLEKMNKINFADHCSELRRKVQELEESYAYLGMLSKIDIFERDRRRKGESFWANSPQAATYTHYMALQQRLKKLKQTISEEENYMALACLDMEPYSPGIKTRLEEWSTAFFDYKKDLIGQIEPTLNQADLLIYGAEPTPIANFYRELLDAEEWECVPACLFLQNNGQWKWESILPGTDDFDKTQAKGARCFGFHLRVTGPLALTYLAGEEGRHDWRLSEEEVRPYVVAVQQPTPEIEVPQGIQRKDFYKNNPRRIVSPQHIKDNKYRINREVNKGALPEVMKMVLKIRFIGEVEMLLT